MDHIALLNGVYTKVLKDTWPFAQRVPEKAVRCNSWLTCPEFMGDIHSHKTCRERGRGTVATKMVSIIDLPA